MRLSDDVGQRGEKDALAWRPSKFQASSFKHSRMIGRCVGTHSLLESPMSPARGTVLIIDCQPPTPAASRVGWGSPSRIKKTCHGLTWKFAQHRYLCSWATPVVLRYPEAMVHSCATHGVPRTWWLFKLVRSRDLVIITIVQSAPSILPWRCFPPFFVLPSSPSSPTSL